MKTRQQIYELVTDQIIQQLEQGTIPWQKEWAGQSTGPFNFLTGKSYKGINYWNLSTYPFKSPAWLTFKQVQTLKLKLKKGSKSATVLFWKLLEVTDEESGKQKKIPFPKIYNVFNTKQVEGIDYQPEKCPYALNKSCEDIVQGFERRPLIHYSTNNEAIIILCETKSLWCHCSALAVQNPITRPYFMSLFIALVIPND
jgi:antirestriction protein ArdC